MINLNENYWTERYQEGQTGWDIGTASTPLKEYINQLEDKSIRILIPGAGNGHEALYLQEQGFQNVSVIDISKAPLDTLQEKLGASSAVKIYHADFFQTNTDYFGGGFDLILEQTFFCALNPTLRAAYVKQMHQLLCTGGKLAGVLFNIPLFEDHPPFGGHLSEYKPLFSPYFHFKHFDACYNSIAPRANNELFICLEKKEL